MKNYKIHLYNSGSARFQLNWDDTRKILTGLGIALAGALIPFLSSLTQTYDFGTCAPIIGGICAVGVNALRKWIADNRE